MGTGMTFVAGQVYVLPKILDGKVARLHLKKVGMKLIARRKVQADYLCVPVEGPYKTIITGIKRDSGSGRGLLVRSGGSTSVELERQAFIARLAALAPPHEDHLNRHFRVRSSHAASGSEVLPAREEPTSAPGGRDNPAAKLRYIRRAELIRRTFGLIAMHLPVEWRPFHTLAWRPRLPMNTYPPI